VGRWVPLGAAAVLGAAVVGAAVVGAAVVAGAVYVGSDEFRYGGQRDVDLGGWLDPADPWTRSVAPGARDATAELCDAGRPCTQAVRADTMTLYRFADRGDAVATARDLAGEAYLSGWVVVHFDPGGLTAAQRREVALTLDCSHVGVAEDGTEC
jgi:hypothetical protein